MQTTTYAKISKQKIKDFEFKKFKLLLKSTINKMTKYIKGHKMIIDPIVNENVISVKTNTIGNGDLYQNMQVI